MLTYKESAESIEFACQSHEDCKKLLAKVGYFLSSNLILKEILKKVKSEKSRGIVLPKSEKINDILIFLQAMAQA